MPNSISLAVIIVSLIAATVLGGLLVAEHAYGRAAADCARFGAVPAATETLAYRCVTP